MIQVVWCNRDSWNCSDVTSLPWPIAAPLTSYSYSFISYLRNSFGFFQPCFHKILTWNLRRIPPIDKASWTGNDDKWFSHNFQFNLKRLRKLNYQLIPRPFSPAGFSWIFGMLRIVQILEKSIATTSRPSCCCSQVLLLLFIFSFELQVERQGHLPSIIEDNHRLICILCSVQSYSGCWTLTASHCGLQNHVEWLWRHICTECGCWTLITCPCG